MSTPGSRVGCRSRPSTRPCSPGSAAAELLGGHAARLPPTRETVPCSRGLDGGIVALVDALVRSLAVRGVQVQTSTTVRELVATTDGYRLTVGSARDPLAMTRAVVLAAPAAATGRLLSGLVGSAERLAAIPYASMAVVALRDPGRATSRLGSAGAARPAADGQGGDATPR